ncbi:DUF3703 domain-containing protein [Kitasatospora sp. NPDC096077]|uniref:DUF3703 domain-containing protein n=1 Tax=unclassified Kitasatospora TaxID=2633591 RepID=UPI0033222EA1
MPQAEGTLTAAYESEMQAGREALSARDFRSAYRHFGRAHNIGHDNLVMHVAAHRGLLATAWKQCRLDRVGTQLFLMGAAYAFDRNPRPQATETPLP